MKLLFQNKIFLFFIYLFAVIGFVFTTVFILMQFGLLNVRGSIEERNEFFGVVPVIDHTNGCVDADKESKEEISCDWSKTAEWKVVEAGLTKDKDIIQEVALKVGVSPRIIASAVIPEQIRFFTSNRESFKRYFEPFKVLGSMSKFSLGVSGIKQETAVEIEKHTQDSSSPFYPGDGISSLVAYNDQIGQSEELFKRLTDSKNHYYSYLYTAIYLKEIQVQWANAGFDVKNRPDVLVTLFNLGFDASVPKADPKVAGSVVTVGGKSYSFGSLGTQFYNSSLLLDIFPR
ncbi:MAG: hypothetical protein AAB510_00025 [Patescibacteria group bacterium]